MGSFMGGSEIGLSRRSRGIHYKEVPRGGVTFFTRVEGTSIVDIRGAFLGGVFDLFGAL